MSQANPGPLFAMSGTLFKEVRDTFGGLDNGIGMGEIGPPDIQRPFLRINANVRDPFNQIANDSVVEWGDSIARADVQPSEYLPRYAARFVPATLAFRVRWLRWHALPQDWWTLSYEDFLVARRPLIADVIRQGYDRLTGVSS